MEIQSRLQNEIVLNTKLPKIINPVKSICKPFQIENYSKIMCNTLQAEMIPSITLKRLCFEDIYI